MIRMRTVRAVALLGFVLLWGPQLARGQIGTVCLFSDPGGAACSFQDSAPGLLNFYAVHSFTSGATAVQFSAPMPPCMIGATWVSDTPPFGVTIGTSQTGVAIGYGGCFPGPIHVLTITYLTAGTTLPDCAYPVLPYPAAGAIQATDCENIIYDLPGSVTYVNSSRPCECEGSYSGPVLGVTPTSLDFAYNESQKSFDVLNLGTGTLSWTAVRHVYWLTLSPTSGENDGAVTVTVNRGGIAPGTYEGLISVTSNGGGATVSVTMAVLDTMPPLLGVTPTSLDFGSSATVKSFSISNMGGNILEWTILETIPWVSASPTAGTGDGTVAVTVNRSGLTPGVYTGEVAVTSNGGNETVVVSMTVPEPVPILGFSPRSLAFDADVDTLGLNIYNNGDPGLEWTIIPGQTWLSVVPSSGTEGATVSVGVDRSGLPDGTYGGNLNITSNGGNGSVPVIVTVATMPVLTVNPTTLVFSSTTNSKSFAIDNAGVGALEWQVSTSDSWIVIDPPLSGSGPQTVVVRLDRGQLPGPGQQTGHIQVTSNGGDATVTVISNPPPASTPGAIGLFADPQGYECAIIDQAPALISVYVVHVATPGATASQFSAPMPACMTGVTYLADQPLWPVTLGNSQTGVSIGYGACLAAPNHILTILYFGQGASQHCCLYPVLPDPASPQGSVLVVGCQNELLIGTGLEAAVNPDGSCICGALVPTHETTWGGVKALFAPEKAGARPNP